MSSEKGATRLHSLLAAGKSNWQIFTQHFEEAGPDSLQRYFSFDISVNHQNSCHYHLNAEKQGHKAPCAIAALLAPFLTLFLLSCHLFEPVHFTNLCGVSEDKGSEAGH